MDIVVRNAKYNADVRIKVGEVIDVKGAIFKVCTMDSVNRKFELQPASIGEIKNFQKTNKSDVKSPSLNGGNDSNVNVEEETKVTATSSDMTSELSESSVTIGDSVPIQPEQPVDPEPTEQPKPGE